MSHPQDHFSAIASQYREGRFGYPAELFHYLAGIAPGRGLAWDCATGSGQAALGLAPHFEKVLGTDISAALLALAPVHPGKIEWRQCPAEDCGLAEESADLITVAQALHWFDLPRFWTEARRVLKPGGVLAFWGYVWPGVNEEVDRVLTGLRGALAECWPEKIRLLHAEYHSLQPPFPELEPPVFEASARWTLEEYLAHFCSWSATRYHRERHGGDVVEDFRAAFVAAWPEGGAAVLKVRWPLFLRVFRKAAE